MCDEVVDRLLKMNAARVSLKAATLAAATMFSCGVICDLDVADLCGLSARAEHADDDAHGQAVQHHAQGEGAGAAVAMQGVGSQRAAIEEGVPQQAGARYRHHGPRLGVRLIVLGRLFLALEQLGQKQAHHQHRKGRKARLVQALGDDVYEE